MDVRGEILLISENAVEWKVPHFFSLPEYINYNFESPPFTCLQRTWSLVCFPNCRCPSDIYIYLNRKSPVSKTTFVCRTGIKAYSGLEYRPHTFYVGKNELGIYLNLGRGFLRTSKGTLAPKGEVTFFCVFEEERSGKEAAQAAHPDGACLLSESPQADSSKTGYKKDAASSEFSSTSGLNNLALNLMDIYLNEKHSDLVVTVKEQEFKAHKAILGARSSVFSAMFTHDTQEKISNTVEITDCEPEAFRHFLAFLYSGQVEKVPGKQVFDLYYIADKYDVEELKKECANFLGGHITIDTFCDVMRLALTHKETPLLENATHYFIKHANEINVTVKWLSFIKEYPIESNELNIKTIKYLKC